MSALSVGLLDDVKVVDATRLLPGGYCTMLLSDLGAGVIKVEQPGLGDYMRATPPTKNGESPVNQTVNRNKLSIGINLKDEEGRRVLRKILETSDVFVEGFRPGAMRRLGFSYPEVRRINPKIVYCSISTFGQKSVHSLMPAHDINFQALAGSLAYSARPRVPMLQLGDMSSGMFAALGILAGLAGKRRPVFIDVPIVQSLLSWMVIPISSYLATGKSPIEGESLVLGSEPYYGIFETSDGGFVAVAAIEEEFWHNLLRVLGLSRQEGKRFGSPAERSEVASMIREAFASKTRDQWATLLAGKHTAATPVLNLKEALRSDWARSSGMLTRIRGDGIVINTPIVTSPRSRSKAFTPAPRLGEQTDKIMRGLGYSPAQIARLKRLRILE